MARLVAPAPDNTPAEWGKRLAYLACVLLPVILLLAVYLYDHKKTQAELTWNDITLSETPPMATEEFLREVRAIGGFLDTLDPGDSQLFEMLRQACLRHEWVEQVSRVSLKAPHQIHFDLQFRVPLARLQRGTLIHLVDRHGKILLPLTSTQGNQLISLIGWDDSAMGNAEAMTWLAHAAQLVQQLQADLSRWQIASLHLARDTHLDTAELRLKTRNGSWIIWQSLKGPAVEEPAWEEKQSRLRVYHERYGSLDAPAGQMLDVRSKEGLQRRPVNP